MFELKVPHGLIEARIDLSSEGLQNPAVTTWSRVPHPDENLNTPRTSSPWPILNRDDDSIIIGESAR
jgi:hypothetical protein